MKALDRRAISKFHIPVLLLMDNAGRCVAETARRYLGQRKKSVIVLAGGGNNGGDGVVAARYLAGWGYKVEVWWMKNPAEWTGDLATHYRIAKSVGVVFRSFLSVAAPRRIHTLKKADLLVDALLGTGFTGPLRVLTYDAIVGMNASRVPVLAVDIPSGLDSDTGRAPDVAAKARWTVTMAAPKKGLLTRHAKPYVGKLIVADIGIPF